MEANQGMTRYTIRKLFTTILRRWYWPIIFAIACAFLFSLVFWYKYYSTYRVSTTFIPASVEVNTANGGKADLTSYNLLLYRSLVKNDEVLDAVSKSLDFDAPIGQLQNAITTDTDENSVAVNITIQWSNQEQAARILDALKANLTFAITHSAKAGVIKWMDAAAPAGSAQAGAGTAQSYQIFFIGFIVGLLLGAVLSFFLGSIDKRVYELEGVRYGDDVHVLGVVCKSGDLRVKPGKSRLGLPYKPNKQLIAIALYLNKLMEAHDKKLIMCVSPTGKCGATTVVHNIAQILSGIKMKILIVTVKSKPFSAQSEKPEITSLYPGVDECVFSWDESESNRAFIGPISTTLSYALKEYKLILVDCPALLENIQVSMFASGMDATLLVCGYGKTKYDEVLSAVSLLSRAEAKPIYCVWNNADNEYNKFYIPIEPMLDSRKVTNVQS